MHLHVTTAGYVKMRNDNNPHGDGGSLSLAHDDALAHQREVSLITVECTVDYPVWNIKATIVVIGRDDYGWPHHFRTTGCTATIATPLCCCRCLAKKYFPFLREKKTSRHLYLSCFRERLVLNVSGLSSFFFSHPSAIRFYISSRFFRFPHHFTYSPIIVSRQLCQPFNLSFFFFFAIPSVPYPVFSTHCRYVTFKTVEDVTLA